MKKVLTIIILFAILVSCKKTDEKEHITELIVFGYSGFCLKDSLNNTYPKDQICNCDSINLEYDSTELDIRQYLEFKKDSFLRIAVKKPKQETEYYTSNKSDTIGFNNLINSFLSKDLTPHNNISNKYPEFYEGWSYTLYFKTNKNRTFSINYIPYKLLSPLKEIHESIESTINKCNQKRVGKFEYNTFTTFEAKRLFRNATVPPPPFPRNRIKFIAPEIKGEDK